MKKELITHKNPKSPNSEIFRTLRTNIQFMNTNKRLKTLLVTSTFPGEGKSWVASNLAVTFAQAGNKVVLIDADMRKGRQYSIFGVAPKPGLSNFLADSAGFETNNNVVNVGSCIQETGIDNLYVIAAGNVPPNPSELLVSTQMIKLLDELKEVCDIIIIDGTPCELVADSIILSRIVDSCIIIAGHKITKKEALQRVIRNIQNVGGHLAGVVLNKVPTTKGYGSRYYYYGDHKSSSNSSSNFAKDGIKKLFEKRQKTNTTATKKEKIKFEQEMARLQVEMKNQESTIQENKNNSKQETRRPRPLSVEAEYNQQLKRQERAAKEKQGNGQSQVAKPVQKIQPAQESSLPNFNEMYNSYISNQPKEKEPSELMQQINDYNNANNDNEYNNTDN